ncbi:oligosaccharide flippase family protein [Crocinitomicaceae bacterium]|nr:oligosaccharide flippase family protein [Crocinitomicaceae bacterium]
MKNYKLNTPGIFRVLKNKIASDSDHKEMFNKSFYALVLRVFGLSVNFIFVLLTTKLYGAEGWGIFAICFSILQLCSLIGCFGINISIIKLIPQGNINTFKLYLIILKFIIPVNIFLTLLLYLIAPTISTLLTENGQSIEEYIKIISFGILPLSITIINSGLFRAKKQIISFTFFDNLGKFFFGIIVIGLVYFIYGENKFTMITGFVTGLYILASISILKVIKIIKNDSNKIHSNEDSTSLKSLLSLSSPIFWANFIGFGSFYVVTIILAFFVSKEDVALFDVANRLAGVLTIILFAVNSISGPKFAESASNKKLLGKIVHQNGQLLFYSSSVLFVILLISGNFLLSFFGYVSIDNSYLIFVLILIGQLINNLSGSVRLLLQMTGYHLFAQKISIYSFLFISFSLVVFVPLTGLIGASVIISINIAVKNIIMVVFVYRKLNIRSFYIPLR